MTLAGAATASFAADIVAVRPLTDRILMVRFDEGSIQYHGKGQKRTEDIVNIVPLDTERAINPAAYTLDSPDDSGYVTGLRPLGIWRKSKGTEFAWFVDKWENNRAVNSRPDHVKDHWLYLRLPRPLLPGRTYRLSVGDLAKNGSTFRFTWDKAKTRSDAVHANHLGYVPDARQKFAYVYGWLGDGGALDTMPLVGTKFEVLNLANGQPALEGKLAFRSRRTNPETGQVGDTPNANFTGADILEADFSALRTPGKYVVYVEGVGASYPFEIGASVVRPAYRAVVRALYHNRSGIALTKPYTEFERPAPHNPRVTPGFAGKLKYTSVRFQDWGSEGGDKAKLEAGFKGDLTVSGWYQDAGDWDSYTSHLRVATDLLFAYQLRPENFADGENNIPESGNGIPDILDEAAWLPRFCYRLRQELLQKKFGTGGIGLRIAGDAFGGDGEGVPSYLDANRIWAASGEDPESTMRYAGVAAHLALAFKQLGKPDPEGIDWVREARESYEWANRNLFTYEAAVKPFRTYAAAGLWQLTNDPKYRDQFFADTKDITPTTELWEVNGYGPGLYGLGLPKTATLPVPVQAYLYTADQIVKTARARGLRWGGNFMFPMLIGQQTTPWVLEAMVGWGIATRQGETDRAQTYLDVIQTTADYFLGTNPLNYTWMTGVGHEGPTHIFHMDAWYNGKGRYQEGLIPYSPWRKEKDFGQGPWDSDWGNQTVYPALENWPGAERWWNNRCSPMGSEFTVHQNLGPAAAVYSFLAGPAVRK